MTGRHIRRAVFALVVSSALGLFGLAALASPARADAAPVAPAFTSPASATFWAGFESEFTITTTGNPAPEITETGDLPDGITLTDNGDGTATLKGAAEGGARSYDITLTAANGVAPPPPRPSPSGSTAPAAKAIRPPPP